MATPPIAVPALLADVEDLPGVLSWIKEASQSINTLLSSMPSQGTANKVFVLDNTTTPQPMPVGNRDGDLLVVMPTTPTGGTPKISIWRSSLAQANAKTGATVGGQWVRIN